MNLKPILDKILVKRTKKEDNVTEGGIIIPDTVDEYKSLEGEVVALGSGVFEDGEQRPFKVNVGDRVVFSSWASVMDYEIDDEEYSFITEENIIGVLN